jgi:GNAT superfamily N-acetyltransferase
MRDTRMVLFRKARRKDLRGILELLNDGKMGVVGDIEGRIVASLQLTFIPGIAHQGAWRAQVEAVRVARDLRGGRVGEAMIGHVIDLARERGYALVQLTPNKARGDAQRFYRRLGFVASHEGMKLRLR